MPVQRPVLHLRPTVFILEQLQMLSLEIAVQKWYVLSSFVAQNT